MIARTLGLPTHAGAWALCLLGAMLMSAALPASAAPTAQVLDGTVAFGSSFGGTCDGTTAPPVSGPGLRASGSGVFAGTLRTTAGDIVMCGTVTMACHAYTATGVGRFAGTPVSLTWTTPYRQLLPQVLNVTGSWSSGPGGTNGVFGMQLIATFTSSGGDGCGSQHSGAQILGGTVAPGPLIAGFSPCERTGELVESFDSEVGLASFSVSVFDRQDTAETCLVVEEAQGRTVEHGTIVSTRMPVRPEQVDHDAPPGDGPGSPCPVQHYEGGTSTTRAYARTGPGQSPAFVCVGVRTVTGERHVRVRLG